MDVDHVSLEYLILVILSGYTVLIVVAHEWRIIDDMENNSIRLTIEMVHSDTKRSERRYFGVQLQTSVRKTPLRQALTLGS